MRPRKDYGCPLRIYHGTGLSYDMAYTVLPPRSAQSCALFGHPAVGDKRLACLHFGGGLWPGYARPGPHLGRRITWAELPAAVQAAVRGSFMGEYCPPEV